MKKFLSLGAGVQSSVVLLMSDKGELPRLDAAIFADTGWERQETYEHLEWLKTESSIPVHVVSRGNLRDTEITAKLRGRKSEGDQFVSMPLRVLHADGSDGMVKRQCTNQYKIQAIRESARSLAGWNPRGPAPNREQVELWFGISFDEVSRMHDSDVQWAVHAHPLCDLRKTRAWCHDWADKHYRGRKFPRSACIGCPYRGNAEWRDMKQNSPSEWKDAIEFDRAIRSSISDGEAFLHRDCRPLETVNLDEDQGELWNECCDGGVCGV